MKSHEHNSNHESDNFATLVREAVAGEALPASDPTLREALLKRLDQPAVEPALKTSMADRRRTFFQRAGIVLASTAALALVGVIWQRPALERAIGMNAPQAAETTSSPVADHFGRRNRGLGSGRGAGDRPEGAADTSLYSSRVEGVVAVEPRPDADHLRLFPQSASPFNIETNPGIAAAPTGTTPASQPAGPAGLAPAIAEVTIAEPQPAAPLSVATPLPPTTSEAKSSERLAAGLIREEEKLQKLATASETGRATIYKEAAEAGDKRLKDVQDLPVVDAFTGRRQMEQINGEQYAKIVENRFLSPLIVDQALSTFAIDVDTASYANVRRFLTSGQLPPPDAVRLEEMVNYFKYKYPQPKGDDPFSVSTEMADCPWQPGHKLLRVGVQGKEIHRAERPASNIVFLIDTSGSMTEENKLPLLKQAFTMLVGELNENDKVTIVTYAGNAGLRLPPTRGHEKETIIAAIDGMQSGGSTHGSAGISLAYEIAAAQFIKGGTNKVILATDGDLNVGITDDAALVDLITKKAKSGVYLTVLGVGTGNLKDAKMERLADNGNGVYAYLDTVKEARKVLVEEMSGSLVTIAKDVKIQLEFNPNYVHSYRLLGYENRVMANEDFRNDAKDAGEIGAGHSVTAMYEIVLADGAKKSPEPQAEAKPADEELEFQRFETKKSVLTEAGKSDKLLNVRLRYKTPEATEKDAAKELKFPVTDKGGSFNSASKDFQFASSVVAFGLALRQSEYRGSANFSAVAEIASATLGEDVGGHRAEFVDLVKRAKTLRGE